MLKMSKNAPSLNLLADVLRIQLLAACIALKTAQMPVFVQGNQ